jgi:hypothetical protein
MSIARENNHKQTDSGQEKDKRGIGRKKKNELFSFF